MRAIIVRIFYNFIWSVSSTNDSIIDHDKGRFDHLL